MVERLTSALVYLALPVVGIFFFDWDWRSIVVLYWLQNITLGLKNVFDMARTRTPDPVGSGISFKINGRPVSPQQRKPALIIFFFVHYGIFTVVHGVFVMLLTFGVLGRSFGGAFEPASSTASFTSSLGGLVLVWAIGSIVQLVFTFFTPRSSLPPISSLFCSPYLRIVVLHLTVLLAAFVITKFDWPPAAALLLVGLQFVVDLWRPATHSHRGTA